MGIKESALTQKSSLTTSDYIRVVGSDNVSYKQGLSSVADAVGSYNATATLLTDCNDATDPSKIYYANDSTANRPTTIAWYFIKCEAYNGNMLFQTAFNLNTTNVGVWQRSRNTGGTWGAWVKVPTRAEMDMWVDKSASSAIADCNSATSSGIYIVDSNTTNKPATFSFGAMLVIRSTSANYLIQIVFVNDAANNLFFRKRTGASTWNAWRKISTEAI